ncbi:hypothetical protein AGMMS49975_18700 [Clostridia bacterium]|nr:hypothetical protein AGMMS49975_18700 [Clostridia bacterium]
MVNGELEPAVQTSVVRLTMNGQVYTMTADWKPTAARTDSAATWLCDCTVGVHNRNECTNLDLGLVADAFELRFNLDSIAPPLQTGDKFIALQHPSLNGPGLRYDIVGRDIVYNVDQDASIRESWERGKALYLQTGANSAQGYNVHLPKLLEGMNAATAGCVFCDCASLRSANLLTRKSSTGALDVCDLANDNISEVRGYIGTQINRLMYAGNSVAVSSENLSAAESRIRDADMAKETMNLAKSKTLEQSSFSMLAQANQTPQTVLRLLQ